jgi:hypothetical protein
MDAVENYERIVNDVFGPEKVRIRSSGSVANSVISALNDDKYQTFAMNFRNRLERLNKIYKGSDQLRNLISKVCNIADNNNWEGAYAELTAYDFLNKGILDGDSLLIEPVTLEIKVAKSRTFAKESDQGNEISIDGFFKNFNVYFDVKSFKNNVSEILKYVVRKVHDKFPNHNFHIVPEYPRDFSYDVIEINRNNLIEEIASAIKSSGRPQFVKSNIVDQLGFRLQWSRGMVLTESLYNPYQHAMNMSETIFDDCHQFVKDAPFFLIYVVFPWYNNIVNDFRNQNRDFYRAFSRRVFCEYMHDRTPYSDFNPEFSGSQTRFEITQKLTGLMFLEDKIITGSGSEDYNIEAFVYFNPNAGHSSSLFYNYYILTLRPSHFDDFSYDNY